MTKKTWFILSALFLGFILAFGSSPAQAQQDINTLHAKQALTQVVERPIHGVCDPDATFCENENQADSASALPYWAEGWQFEGRTVCLESTRAGAPLSSVRNDYISAVNGLVQITPATAVGECSNRGYPLSQQIKVYSYSSSTDGWCGYAQIWTVGASVHHANIYINEHPDRVGCRDAASWPSLWEHEVGHVAGLAHTPAAENSVMAAILNDKRVTPQVDGPRLANIYGNNPLFGNGV